LLIQLVTFWVFTFLPFILPCGAAAGKARRARFLLFLSLRFWYIMPYEIITIPFNAVTKSFHADELSRFCINKKIINKEIEFFQDEKNLYWTVFIEYETILEHTVNEPKGLTQAGKLCYERLREWRKQTAEKQGIPPFVIAKNSHLVEIINKEIKTMEGLKQIKGFGKKKVEKYGKDIIDLVKAFFEIRDER
jgi:superfamily II DNA helicase RecQ